MTLFVAGLSHKTAPVELREKLAVSNQVQQGVRNCIGLLPAKVI